MYINLHLLRNDASENYKQATVKKLETDGTRSEDAGRLRTTKKDAYYQADL